MDDLLGVDGKSIPDGVKYPGRDKVKWKLDDGWNITHENHGHDNTGCDTHDKPHWHVNNNKGKHDTYQDGDTIPDEGFKHLP